MNTFINKITLYLTIFSLHSLCIHKFDKNIHLNADIYKL